MKRKKWIVWLGACLLLFAVRGILFRALVDYRSVGERSLAPLSDPQLAALLRQYAAGERPIQLPETARIARSITAHSLSFNLRSAAADPNAAYRAGKANCIGYAALYASVCREIFRNSSVQGRFQVMHKVGKLYFLGMDVHRLFSDPFFKDHDYVEIRDTHTGRRLCIDPSLGDYTGIYRVRAN